MKDESEKLEQLWQHVTGVCRNVPSPAMLVVKEAMAAALVGDQPNLRPLFDAAHRIGKHVDFFRDEAGYLQSKIEGEWHVTNADLKLWSDLSLFGDRDYFPKSWHWLGNDIGPAIGAKRKWQAYTRYIDRGRLRPEHRKLLGRMIWDMRMWRDHGATLYVQGKRPFGNSDIEGDMHEILGWDRDWPEDGEMPAAVEERLWDLFDELLFAIRDVLKAS